MDGRRRWWDGVWCWNWYWQTVAVLCLSIQGRRTYRATGKGTFFVGPSPNRGGGGCPTYVGATLSKDGHLHPGRDGEPAILATVDSAVEFREGPNILSVRPGVGMPARLTLADSQWSCGPPAHSTSAGHKSGMPAAQPAPSPPPAACITYGSWARDGLPALHMDILLQSCRETPWAPWGRSVPCEVETRDPVGGIRDLARSACATEVDGPVVPDF